MHALLVPAQAGVVALPLSEEAHEPFDDTLNKAQASRRIEELQARTGRGRPQSEPSRARWRRSARCCRRSQRRRATDRTIALTCRVRTACCTTGKLATCGVQPAIHELMNR